MSSEDIEKGSRWASTIGSELEGTNFGLLCLTHENIDAPWICFEAGALAKLVEHSRVAPILFGVQPSDIQGPLAQFQATKFEKGDIMRLLRGINASTPDEARDDAQIEKVVDYLWPALANTIEPIVSAVTGKERPKREKSSATVEKVGPILEELLVLVRQQTQIVSDPAALLPARYFRQVIDQLSPRRDRELSNPAYLYDLSKHWIRFEKEWRFLMPTLISVVPAERVDRLRQSYARLDDVIGALLHRYDASRHPKWLRPTRRTSVGTPPAQAAQSSLAVGTQPELQATSKIGSETEPSV